jgi:hypothetical protein
LYITGIKKDLRFKNGTKGNTQTKAVGFAGAILVLVLGTIIQNKKLIQYFIL